MVIKNCSGIWYVVSNDLDPRSLLEVKVKFEKVFQVVFWGPHKTILKKYLNNLQQKKKRINFVREDRVFTYVLDSELKIYHHTIWTSGNYLS